MNIPARYSKLLSLRFIFFYFLSVYFPARIWNRGLRRATRSGLIKSTFLLSFDCDTELDISVVEFVHDKLLSLGIRPVYAVPGELLIAGSEVYKRIRDSGAEFINHGFRRHSEVLLPHREYKGTFFYEHSQNSEIIKDIELGHKAIKEVLGVEATVFRAPHFGGFSKPNQLRLLWDTLSSLNYEISTSTTPFFAYRYGPNSIHSGICELPVSGDPKRPHRILDSWSYTFSGHNSLSRFDFIDAINQIAVAMNSGEKVFLNIYADPSQVYDWPEFFESITELSAYNVDSFITARAAFNN